MRVDSGGVRSGAPLPELDVANYTSSGWKDWLVLFRRHVGPSFNNFSNPKKVSTLLSRIGPNAVHIVDSFDAGDRVPYNDLLNLFGEYFATVGGRVAFYRRAQKADEDFARFAGALDALSYACRLGPSRGAAVRDLFIANLHPRYDELRGDLMKLIEPTIDELIRLCEAQSSVESPPDESDASEKILLPCDERAGNGQTPQAAPDPCDADKEAIPDSKALKDISNINDSLANSESKECDLMKNGVHGSENEETLVEDRSGENEKSNKIELPNMYRRKTSIQTAERDSSKNGVHGSESEETLVEDRPGENEKSNKIELPNMYRRKTSIQTAEQEVAKKPDPSKQSFSNRNGDRTLPQTSVSSRLSKYSGNQPDRQARRSDDSQTTKTGQNETDAPQRAKGDSSTSLTQFMKMCQQVSLNNSKNVEGKSKFLSSGTVAVCKGAYSSEEDKESDDSNTEPSTDASNISKADKSSDTSNSSQREDSADPSVAPEAPIPKSRFTDVTVVYIPEEGDRLYVCETSRIPFMQELEADLKLRADVLDKVEDPATGRVYAAPWSGEWYRGRVVGRNGAEASVVFSDYGNEEDVPAAELRLLPEEYEGEPPSAFPVRPPRTRLEIAFDARLRIRPVRFAGGAWDVEIADAADP